MGYRHVQITRYTIVECKHPAVSVYLKSDEHRPLTAGNPERSSLEGAPVIPLVMVDHELRRKNGGDEVALASNIVS